MATRIQLVNIVHQYFSSERSMHPQHLCGGMIFAQWQCHQQCWTLSVGTEVACTARYLRASFVSQGGSCWCCFHRSWGSWLKGSLCRHLYLWTSALAISRVQSHWLHCSDSHIIVIIFKDVLQVHDFGRGAKKSQTQVQLLFWPWVPDKKKRI